MRIGIVGYGVVGSAIASLFHQTPQHSIVVYDKFQPEYQTPHQKTDINHCDLVFLCVPTPPASDGLKCDLSAVEECVAWITAPLCIRSTIPPGTVDRLSQTHNRCIAFCPEYLGEGPHHPWRQEGRCGFLIVGGPLYIYDLIKSLYGSCFGLDLRYFHTRPRVAELCKYMENCFLATKVAFVNQFFDISQMLNVDFVELRELWLADPRIGESHTVVTQERGFRGRCLPKDVAALVAELRPFGGAPLLEAVLSFNVAVCQKADRAMLSKIR